MAQVIDVAITTESGKSISPFSHLTINQQINGHHYFELRFNHDVLERRNAVLIDKTKDFLGQSITISMKTKNGPENTFKGVITDIGIANSVGAAGDIIFKGFSPTVLLESGQATVSHTKKNLSQIVKDSMKSAPSNLLASDVNPKYKTTLPYVVQYRETSFHFLRRLAGEHGEWFYYDGTTFHFGKPSSSPSIELKYPRDISDLNLNVKVAPLKFDQVDYFSRNNERFNSNSDSASISGLDTFGDKAQRVSNSLFTDKPIVFSQKKAGSKSDLDEWVKAEKASRAAEMVCLNASSDSPELRPGCTVKIVSSLPNGKGEEDFGKYVVTGVIHATDGLGNYHNTFEAIPSTIQVPPNQHDAPPKAEPQMGFVKQNNDPDKIGRVKVQLLWHPDQETTPWIKVMSPHAGTRADGSRNRGIFFTPEVGDLVMVGFAQNDPNRPFVMGSVPHGKAIDTAKNNDNHIKAIRTRSGSTIYFKDKDNDKEQEIVVKTDDQNLISIKVQNGKGVIQIKTTQDIQVISEKTVEVKSEKIKVNGKTITIEASEKIEMKAQTITIDAQQKLAAKAMNASVEGSTSAKVSSSAKLDLEGGAMANLKAGLVKIN